MMSLSEQDMESKTIYSGAVTFPAITYNRSRASQRQRKVLIATLAVSDALMIGSALLLGWYLRIGSGWLVYGENSGFYIHLWMILIAIPVMLLIFTVKWLYNYNFLLGGIREYSAVLSSCTYGMVVLVLISFLEHDQLISRGWLLISWILTIILVGGSRFLWRRYFYWLRRTRGWLITPIAIVGVDEHARVIANQLTSPNSGISVVGFVDEFMPIGTKVMENKIVLGTPDQLHELTTRYNIEQVIVISNAIAWETFRDIIEQAAFPNGFEIQLSPGFYEILTTNVQVTNKAYVPLLRIGQARITGMDKVLKTVLDLSLGSVALVLAAPLILTIALIALLKEGRPVFVRHQVLGLSGEPFWTVKFFTGLTGAFSRRLDSHKQLLAKEGNNNHSGSRVRSFLYHTGMDKIPQLVDVVRGKLSLVGPRTTPAASKVSSWYLSLLTVKPGWTGPWAVGGATNKDDEIRLNLYYIRNWTIWLDLQILFQTFMLVLARRSRKLITGSQSSPRKGKV